MAAATLTPATAVNSSFDPMSSQREVYNDLAVLYIVNIFLSLPSNMYIVWLITAGSANEVASEFFSLNLSVYEIIVCSTSVSCILYILDNVTCMTCFLFYASTIFANWLHLGRPLFYGCVCVERYVAVIHPVTFIKYKPLRYRLAFSAVVWIILIGICTGNMVVPNTVQLMYCAILPYYLILFFIEACCCVAVLKVLRQPGPGRAVRNTEINYMKKKAFRLMIILLVTMVLNLCPTMFLLFVYGILSEAQKVKGVAVVYSLMVLIGFVHPCLYLHRSGKLPFIQH